MFRQIIQRAQSILKQLVLSLIKIYQLCVSPLFGNCCRFYPSCSDYAKDSVVSYGVLKGSYYTLRRLLKCHPLHPGGYDPVPKKQK